MCSASLGTVTANVSKVRHAGDFMSLLRPFTGPKQEIINTQREQAERAPVR